MFFANDPKIIFKYIQHNCFIITRLVLRTKFIMTLKTIAIDLQDLCLENQFKSCIPLKFKYSNFYDMSNCFHFIYTNIYRGLAKYISFICIINMLQFN